MDPKEAVRQVYKEYKEQDEGYVQDVEYLSEKLSTDFLADYSPTFFAGRLDSPIALVSLNPMLGSSHDEEEKLKKDFESYWDFQRNFFDIYPEKLGSAQYYARVENLIRGLQGKSFKESCKSKEAMKEYHKNLINADILPFHSDSTVSRMDEDIRNRMERYTRVTESILKHQDREVLVINGKKPYLYFEPRIDDEEWQTRDLKGGNLEYKTTELLGQDALVIKQDINQYHPVDHRDRYEVGEYAREDLNL